MAQTVYHRSSLVVKSLEDTSKKTRPQVQDVSHQKWRRRHDVAHNHLTRLVRGTLFAIVATVLLRHYTRSFLDSFSRLGHERGPFTSSQFFLKHAQELLTEPVTTMIEPKVDWLEQPNAQYGYPVRKVWSSEQLCPNDEDFNHWIRARNVRWRKPSYLEEHNIWQSAIGDKLGGNLFAQKMGVKVPRILFCTGDGSDALAHYAPPKGRGFVVKDLHGHSAKNVFVMESGYGGINRINQRKMSLEDIQRKLSKDNTTDIYVEELIESGRETPPDDFKFYTFNGKVENIRVIRNRGSERSCMAFYDEHWNRHDAFGCFFYAHGKPNGKDPQTGCYPIQVGAENNTRQFCSDVPPPKTFPKMLETAKRLSERIGVFMRIDMFENADGEVVLGEFTPFSAFGGYHCAAKVVDGCVDSCFLGRAWKENSLSDGEHYEFKDGWEKRSDGKIVKRVLPNLEGGPITPAPDYLKGWDKLSTKEKCARIKDV